MNGPVAAKRPPSRPRQLTGGQEKRLNGDIGRGRKRDWPRGGRKQPRLGRYQVRSSRCAPDDLRRLAHAGVWIIEIPLCLPARSRAGPVPPFPSFRSFLQYTSAVHSRRPSCSAPWRVRQPNLVTPQQTTTVQLRIFYASTLPLFRPKTSKSRRLLHHYPPCKSDDP